MKTLRTKHYQEETPQRNCQNYDLSKISQTHKYGPMAQEKTQRHNFLVRLKVNETAI